MGEKEVPNKYSSICVTDGVHGDQGHAAKPFRNQRAGWWLESTVCVEKQWSQEVRG